jgi:glutaredoxin
MTMPERPSAHDVEPLRLYWQPGCTSCLRTREFLQSRGVAFESINVLANPQAFEALASLGVRTVPVLARGTRYVLAQDLAEVARFAGQAYAERRLAAPELLARIDRLLEVAAEHAERWPAAALPRQLPERPRSHADLLFHVAMIVQGLLDATAQGGRGRLDYEYFERRPPAPLITPQALAAELRRVAVALRRDAAAMAVGAGQRLVATYYGDRPLHEVLERTAWHVAQHIRQLNHLLVDVLGVADARPLDPALLAGLPLPEKVWDAEVQFAARTALD